MILRVLSSLPVSIHSPVVHLPHCNKGEQYRHRSDSILPQSTTHSVEDLYCPPEKIKFLGMAFEAFTALPATQLAPQAPSAIPGT